MNCSHACTRPGATWIVVMRRSGLLGEVRGDAQVGPVSDGVSLSRHRYPSQPVDQPLMVVGLEGQVTAKIGEGGRDGGGCIGQRDVRLL